MDFPLLLGFLEIRLNGDGQFFEIVSGLLIAQRSFVILAAIGFIVKNRSQKLVSYKTRLSSASDRISRVMPCWKDAILIPDA